MLVEKSLSLTPTQAFEIIEKETEKVDIKSRESLADFYIRVLDVICRVRIDQRITIDLLPPKTA